MENGGERIGGGAIGWMEEKEEGSTTAVTAAVLQSPRVHLVRPVCVCVCVWDCAQIFLLSP
jgi:hypothetical protein